MHVLTIEWFRGHTRYVPKNEFWLEGKNSFTCYRVYISHFSSEIHKIFREYHPYQLLCNTQILENLTCKNCPNLLKIF